MATLIKAGPRNYGGTHGNLARAQLSYLGAAAINDVIDFGALPPGIKIVRVVAGSDNAAATTLDVAMVKPDGTSVALAAGVDVNAKFTEVNVTPVETGFDAPDLRVTVKGAAVTATKTVYVGIEYLTIGTA